MLQMQRVWKHMLEPKQQSCFQIGYVSMDFIAKNSPQKYWLGKSFVLLAHIYEKMNDLFQATNTLKSVIENYDSKDDGIVDEASAYLKILEQKK